MLNRRYLGFGSCRDFRCASATGGGGRSFRKNNSYDVRFRHAWNCDCRVWSRKWRTTSVGTGVSGTIVTSERSAGRRPRSTTRMHRTTTGSLRSRRRRSIRPFRVPSSVGLDHWDLLSVALLLLLLSRFALVGIVLVVWRTGAGTRWNRGRLQHGW